MVFTRKMLRAVLNRLRELQIYGDEIKLSGVVRDYTVKIARIVESDRRNVEEAKRRRSFNVTLLIAYSALLRY